MSGLKGYENRRRREKEGGTPIHRPKHSTQRGRDIRKMMEKNNWYKKTPDTNVEDQHRTQSPSGQGSGRPGLRHKQQLQAKIAPTAVMFIPRTPEGKLLTRLREIEHKLSGISRPVRLVEEAGTKLLESLCRGDPWEKTHCQRDQCTTCAPSWGKVGDCRKKNVVYEDVCLTCKDADKSSRYIGESSRTMYERGLEHVSDVKNLGTVSHIREHVLAEHPDQAQALRDAPHTLFSMQIICPARTALSRQIREAVEIGYNKTGGVILNNKEEFTRCLIPSL